MFYTIHLSREFPLRILAAYCISQTELFKVALKIRVLQTLPGGNQSMFKNLYFVYMIMYFVKSKEINERRTIKKLNKSLAITRILLVKSILFAFTTNTN